MVSREDSLKDRLIAWERMTPEQRVERRAMRLELLRLSQGNEIYRTDGLPGNWDFSTED